MARFYSRTFRTALTALHRNAMRSALTGLGITIGIAAVIAMVEIGQGSSQAIQAAIAKMGANVVQIDPSAIARAGVSSGSGGRMTLTPADCDAIRNECPGVRWAVPSVDSHMQIVYGNRNYAPHKVLGTGPEYLLIRNWNVAQGASFTEEDVRRCACVCLLGQDPARELFGDESAVGKEVRMNDVLLRVVGVLQRKGASVTGHDLDDVALVPWTTVKYRLTGVRDTTSSASAAAASSIGGQVNSLSNLYPNSQLKLYPQKSSAQLVDSPLMTRFADLNDIFVSVDSAGDLDMVKQEVSRLLRQRHRTPADQPDDFRIRDWTEIGQTIASTASLMSNLLLCVALISLVVGGVGIMNIMLVSVTERTREIGLRMAVGARGCDILRQFLIEAALLCLAGGIAGIVVGRGVSITITAILGWPTLWSARAMLAAIAVSTAVGLLFGYYPAWKASRQDPIEALRFE